MTHYFLIISPNVRISTHTLTWSVTNSVIAFRTITLISTHTLTWSVTSTADEHADREKISTHTLTWSVTSRRTTRKINIINFNSHAHVERDDRIIRMIGIF